MLRVAGDDLDAFEELVSRHRDRVIGLAYRYLSDSAAAEDLAQEIFLTLFENRHRYEPTAKFTTFLYRITVNRCLNAVRDRKQHHSLIPEAIPGEEKTSGAERREIREQVMNEISKLPEQQRMALVLYQFEDLSYDEIAVTMSSTLSAVKSLIFRARETLRENLSGLMK